jgi:hypothetical protein
MIAALEGLHVETDNAAPEVCRRRRLAKLADQLAEVDKLLEAGLPAALGNALKAEAFLSLEKTLPRQFPEAPKALAA